MALPKKTMTEFETLRNTRLDRAFRTEVRMDASHAGMTVTSKFVMLDRFSRETVVYLTVVEKAGDGVREVNYGAHGHAVRASPRGDGDLDVFTIAVFGRTSPEVVQKALLQVY